MGFNYVSCNFDYAFSLHFMLPTYPSPSPISSIFFWGAISVYVPVCRGLTCMSVLLLYIFVNAFEGRKLQTTF